MTKLTIKTSDEHFRALDEEYPQYSVEIESDLPDATVHEWVKIFEKVLAAQGFSEYVIMNGFAKSAFGESRTPENLSRLYSEYGLDHSF